jgi:hypothetical protein
LELKKNLRFGNSVALVNGATNEEMKQIFWFFFDFKENDRFLIIVFAWSTKDNLFFKRRQKASYLSKEYSRYSHTEKQFLEHMSKTQWHSYQMLMCYSSLFFVETFGSKGHYVCFIDSKEVVSQPFIILDVLRLKREIGGIFEVFSLFPINLLSLNL